MRVRMVTQTRKRESKNEENSHQLQQSPIKCKYLSIIFYEANMYLT